MVTVSWLSILYDTQHIPRTNATNGCARRRGVVMHKSVALMFRCRQQVSYAPGIIVTHPFTPIAYMSAKHKHDVYIYEFACFLQANVSPPFADSSSRRSFFTVPRMCCVTNIIPPPLREVRHRLEHAGGAGKVIRLAKTCLGTRSYCSRGRRLQGMTRNQVAPW